MASELNSYRSRDWERERERREREEEPTNVTNERLPRSDSFNSLYAQGGPQTAGENRASEDEEDDDDEDQIIQAPILRSVSKSKEVSVDKDTNFYTYISSGVGGGRSSSMDPLRSMGSNQPDGFKINIPSMYSKDNEKVKAESATANGNLDEKLPDIDEAQRRREMRRLSRQQSLDRTSSGVSGISRKASGVSGVRVSTITLDDSDDDEKVETPTRFRRTASLQTSHSQGFRDGSGSGRFSQAHGADNRSGVQEEAARNSQQGKNISKTDVKSEDVFKLTEDDLDELENELSGNPPVTMEQQARKALHSDVQNQSAPTTSNKAKKVQLPEKADVLQDTSKSMNIGGILDSTRSEFEQLMQEDEAGKVIKKIVETSAFSVNESEPTTPSPKQPPKLPPKIDEKEFTEEEVETKEEEKVVFEKELPSTRLPKIKTKVAETEPQKEVTAKSIASVQPPKTDASKYSSPKQASKTQNQQVVNEQDSKNQIEQDSKAKNEAVGKVVPATQPNDIDVEQVVSSTQPKKTKAKEEVSQQKQYLNQQQDTKKTYQAETKVGSNLQEQISIEVDSSPVAKSSASTVGASTRLPLKNNSTIAQKVTSEKKVNSSNNQGSSLQEIVEQKRINSDSRVLEGGVQQEKIHTMGSISKMIDEGSGFGGRVKAPMAKVPEDTIPPSSPSPKYSKQFSVGEQSLMDQLANHKPWGESRSQATFSRSISMLERNDSIEAQGGPYNPPTINQHHSNVNSSNPYSSVQLRAAAGEYFSNQSSTNQNNPYNVSLRSAAKSYLSQPANSSSQNTATANSPLDRSTSNISDYSETASSSGSSKVRGMMDRFGGSVVGSSRRSRGGSMVSGSVATPKLDLAKIRTELRSRGEVGTVSMPVSPTSVSKISEIGPYPSAHSSTGPPLRRAESLSIDGNGRKWRYLVRAESMGLLRPVQFTPRAAKPLWMRSERERRRRIAAEARRKWNMSDYAQNLSNGPMRQEVDASSSAVGMTSEGGSAQPPNPKFERTLSKFKVLEETEDHYHQQDLIMDSRSMSMSLVGEKTSQFESPSSSKPSEARERVRRAFSTKSYMNQLREEAMRAVNDE